MRTFGDTVGTVWVLLDFHTLKMENIAKCDPPQDFNAKGESTRTTRFHFKTKEFILTRASLQSCLISNFFLFQRTRLRQLSVSKSNKRAC